MNAAARRLYMALANTTAETVHGADEAVKLLTVALIARGHVLLEGAPGLGKTLLARTLAAQTGGSFKRVQCTADLMPSDITGIHIYRGAQEKFELMPGPVFADILLVDEINRAGPKTQSALLQAMEEFSVTIDRDTYKLSERFMVIATQNPHEFEGTFPLPESQLDRFLLRIRMGYLPAEDERRVLRAYDRPGPPPSPPRATLDPALLEQARRQTADIHVADAVYGYAVNIARASRVEAHVNLGLSHRGALALMRCARATAAVRGAEFVTPDDIKAVGTPVMAHRLILSADAALEGIQPEAVVGAIFNQVPVPRVAPRSETPRN